MTEGDHLSGEGSILKASTTVFIDESKEYVYEHEAKFIADQTSIIVADAGSGSGGGEIVSAKETSFGNAVNISTDEYNIA